MKFKKILFLMIFLVIIFTIPNFAEAANAWDEKMNIGLETFKEWMETFKSEEIPIEKRIKDYEISQYGGGASNNIEDKLEMTVNFKVTPVDEKNTYWEKDYANMCFIKMTKVDGNFEVDYISDKPENYDKFLEEFEEYKKTKETQIVEAEDNVDEDETANNTDITNITNIIYIVSAIVLLVVIIVFVKTKKKKINKN